MKNIATYIVSKDFIKNKREALKFVKIKFGKDNVICYSPLWGNLDIFKTFMDFKVNHYFYVYQSVKQ